MKLLTMNWKEINLEEALQKEKKREQKKKPDEVLRAFQELLRADDEAEEQVLQNLMRDSGWNTNVHLHQLNEALVFTGEQIKRLCVSYRLRFLSARYFKGEIPYEAISKIKALQRSGTGELTDFKILAPASVFNLVEQDKDPLLFLSLGNDRYYLIHKWGRDLNPLRKALVFPFRSFKTLIGCVALMALLVVLSVPDKLMLSALHQNSLSLRIIFFFYVFIAFSGLTVLYGFSRMKNFNGALWNSRYLD